MPVSTDRERSANRRSPITAMLLPLAASPSRKVSAVRFRSHLLSSTGGSTARYAGRRFCDSETASSSRDRLRRRTIERGRGSPLHRSRSAPNLRPVVRSCPRLRQYQWTLPAIRLGNVNPPRRQRPIGSACGSPGAVWVSAPEEGSRILSTSFHPHLPQLAASVRRSSSSAIPA